MAFRDDFQPPPGFQTDDFLVRALTTADAELDYRAVMSSKEFLRVWEGTGWPEDDFTVEANLQDMQKMVDRHNDRHSFGYTVMNLTETECLGCVYIFPTDVNWMSKTHVAALGDDEWASYDTGLSFWTRTSLHAGGLDQRLLDAVSSWLENDWPIAGHLVITVEQLDQQVAMIESTGRPRTFRLTEPDDPAASLAFGPPTTT